MSRCFPYPPPGYALSRASKDALIESIKFQNERVKSKEQKEKRKEKKEKRKEKKDKKIQNPDKPHLVQTQFVEKSWAVTKSQFLPKGNETEPEQLERSGLTEEHDKPLCLRAPSTSSDSTENSNKRKRHSSPLDLTCGQGNKIIRIKLPLKKQKTTEQQPCSTSGRSIFTTQNEDVICSRNVREQICSTSQPIETFVAPKTPKKPTNKVLTPMQRAELQYQSLMDTLVPPQPLDDADDLDWLLNSKSRESCAEKKRMSPSDSMSCSISWGLWPKAQYLQEVDVHALPFTVPF
ncbi:hypothetical protein PHJA_001668400 [Phtheirospermum japonicum]|uniref:Uncharacterized protein n=1 Tax=Phtheirospermum japonicum TaxID=374723 RepID=A0A830C6K8_9LAMI|nr:hypothetical protein PHJA_001668400 [Phtheirospermum japonicum]